MVDFQIKAGKHWHNVGNVSVIGAGFVENELQQREALVDYFGQVHNWDDFVKRLQRLNGFFAVIIWRDNELYAAVDQIRSYPLFYAVYENSVFLSDDPEWIQSQIGGQIIDFVSLFEFLLTGYVTGPFTLDPRIRQLQAGEALRVTLEDSGPSCWTERYHRFLTGKEGSEDPSKKELLTRLDTVTLKAVKRLIDFANGRPIVIPLSGGLDSRLIAISLKRLGYENILAFSYGVKGNWESKISESVARQLGIPWYFVEYSPSLWKQWYWSEECKSYLKYASRLVSLAHLQDWPAVMELTKRGIIPENSVVAPGHTGDFVTGGHIPLELQEWQVYNIRDVITAILHHHYFLMPFKTAAEYVGVDPQDVNKRILQRLQSYFDFAVEVTLNTLEAISFYEYWEWQERQAKYIVNSVRVYDFYGLEWWLPWWDREFMDFWEYVPFTWRCDRRLQRVYIANLQGHLGLKARVYSMFGSQQARKLSLSIKRAVRTLDKTGIIKKIYGAIRGETWSPACRILGLHGAFGLTSERSMNVLGAAALAQLGLLAQNKFLKKIPA